MKCPGQDTRYWKEDAIFEVKCPECGTPVEFFKDDTARTCPGCGKRLPNPRLDFGCAAYCPYAEQCLGSLPPELKEKQQLVFKERIRAEILQRKQGDDWFTQRLLKREGFAEALALEEGAKLAVVLTAAYLWDWPREEIPSLLKELNTPKELREAVWETLTQEQGKEALLLADAEALTERALGQGAPVLRTATAKRLAANI